MASPEVSRRVAWAVHQADASRELRTEIAAAAKTATSFDDLPAWLREFVSAQEAARGHKGAEGR